MDKSERRKRDLICLFPEGSHGVGSTRTRTKRKKRASRYFYFLFLLPLFSYWSSVGVPVSLCVKSSCIGGFVYAVPFPKFFAATIQNEHRKKNNKRKRENQTWKMRVAVTAVIECSLTVSRRIELIRKIPGGGRNATLAVAVE